MSLLAVISVSIIIRLAAMLWSIVLLLRLRDWRIGFFMLMLALMTVRQALTLHEVVEGRIVTPAVTEIPGLLVSILALIGIFFVGSMIAEFRFRGNAIEESEEKFRSLVEKSLVGVYLIQDGVFKYVNPKLAEIFGYRAEELTDKKGPKDLVFPEDWPIVEENLRRRISGEMEAVNYRFRGLTSSEGIIYVEVYGSRTLYRGLPAVIGSLLDITERRKAENKISQLTRVYSVLSGINEAIVRIHDRDKLFQEACRIAVEKGLFKMAWIGIVDKDTSMVKPVADYGDTGGYLDNIRISIREDLPEGRGPTGNAMRTGEPFICNDIEHDPIMLPWREEALKRGYRSSIALPLKAEGRILGTFNLYSPEPRFFIPEEIGLLRELFQDISFALEFIEKDERRRQTEVEVKERVAELEKFYQMAVGRELKMKELKEEIKRLNDELSIYKSRH